VPGGAVTAGHGVIVYRKPQAPVDEEMKHERQVGYVTLNLLQTHP
jgi:hypothetical protein